MQAVDQEALVLMVAAAALVLGVEVRVDIAPPFRENHPAAVQGQKQH